jgi:hypothetical protein
LEPWFGQVVRGLVKHLFNAAKVGINFVNKCLGFAGEVGMKRLDLRVVGICIQEPPSLLKAKS